MTYANDFNLSYCSIGCSTQNALILPASAFTQCICVTTATGPNFYNQGFDIRVLKQH